MSATTKRQAAAIRRAEFYAQSVGLIGCGPARALANAVPLRMWPNRVRDLARSIARASRGMSGEQRTQVVRLFVRRERGAS